MKNGDKMASINATPFVAMKKYMTWRIANWNTIGSPNNLNLYLEGRLIRLNMINSMMNRKIAPSDPKNTSIHDVMKGSKKSNPTTSFIDKYRFVRLVVKALMALHLASLFSMHII